MNPIKKINRRSNRNKTVVIDFNPMEVLQTVTNTETTIPNDIHLNVNAVESEALITERQFCFSDLLKIFSKPNETSNDKKSSQNMLSEEQVNQTSLQGVNIISLDVASTPNITTLNDESVVKVENEIGTTDENNPTRKKRYLSMKASIQ